MIGHMPPERLLIPGFCGLARRDYGRDLTDADKEELRKGYDHALSGKDNFEQLMARFLRMMARSAAIH